MRKPSVIFFNRVYPMQRGATGRMLRDLARAFVRDGWDVTVVTAADRAVRERDGGIRVVRVAAPVGKKTMRAYMSVWFKMLFKGLSLPRHDLVVSMTDPPLMVVAGRIVAARKRSKHIHWCQDVYPDLLPALGIKLPKPVFGFFRRLAYRAMKKCDKVIVIGRCMARHMTHSGIMPGRLTLIPNWPDAELVSTDPKRRRPRISKAIAKLARHARKQGAKTPRELVRDGDPKFRILYSGSLGRAHPLKTIVDAAEVLKDKYEEVEFVFVGDGPRFDALVRERDKRGLSNIRFLPYQPLSRIRDLMESGDLHLITMSEQASGLLVPSKLYSALAVSRPCIMVGPEDCEVATVLREFRAGQIVPQGKPEELVSLIEEYLTSSEHWFAAHDGTAKAGQIYMPDNSMQAWIERARDVIKRPRLKPGSNDDRLAHTDQQRRKRA